MTAGRDLHVGAGTRLWAPDRLLIGNHVYIGKRVQIEANCEIGDYALIANDVAFVGRHDHDFREIGIPVRFARWIGEWPTDSKYRREKVVVESDVWVGYGAIVLTGCTIGRGAVVAAGSVVTRSVAAYEVVAGNPAVVVGHRFKTLAEIECHEIGVARRRFRSSERGYEFAVKELIE